MSRKSAPAKHRYLNGDTIVLSFYIISVLAKVYLSLYFNSPFIFPDETLYNRIAQNIVKGDFQSDLSFPELNLVPPGSPPGYPLFLAISNLLSGDRSFIYHVQLIINSALTSSIIFPSYFILKKFCSRKTSVLGSILVSTLPSASAYNFALMSENLFIPLFVFSIWFLLESYETDQKKFDILTGLSVFLLFLTRAIGIGIIIGLFASFLYYVWAGSSRRSIVSSINRKKFLLLPFFFLIPSWLLYRGLSINEATGYRVQLYSSGLFNVIASGNYLLFLRMFFNEILCLILVSYVVFFLLAASTILKSFEKRKIRERSSFNIMLAYYLTSSTIMLFITIAHMYTSFVLNELGSSREYLIFGRYLDPVIPFIFILGCISLDGLYRSDRRRYLGSGIVITSLFTLGILSFTIPYHDYKFPNMFSIYYLQQIGAFFSARVFLLCFLLTVLFFLWASFRFVKLRTPFLVFVILLSIFLTIPTYLEEARFSDFYDHLNDIGRYLDKNSGADSLVLMDSPVSGTPPEPQMLFLTVFWSKGGIILETLNSSNPFLWNDKAADYVISTKLENGEAVECSDAYRLYRPGIRGSVSLNKAYDVENEEIRDHLTSCADNLYQTEIVGGLATRWMDNNASVSLYSAGKNRYRLSFRTKSFHTSRTLQIFVNNASSKNVSVAPSQFLDVELVLELEPGINSIKFYTPDDCEKPYGALKSNDVDCLSLAFQNITLMRA